MAANTWNKESRKYRTGDCGGRRKNGEPIERRRPVARDSDAKLEVLPRFQRFSNLDLHCLSYQLVNFFYQHHQSDAEYSARLVLHNELQRILRLKFPRSGLYITGSTVTGFAIENADVDFCWMISPEELNQDEAIRQLRAALDVLKADDFATDMKLLVARIPILKFACRIDPIPIHCDLNVNNPTAIRNTYLLYHYAKLDVRVRPLVLAVKIWAKKHKIGSAWTGGLSSYSWVLLVINYLQCCYPCVLPCLHGLLPIQFHDSVDIRDLVPSDDHINPLFSSFNTESLGELFLGFFAYYGHIFDFENMAVSVRMGGMISADECRYRRDPKNCPLQWKWIHIEEPFDRTNTARSVTTFDQYVLIKTAFISTYSELTRSFYLASVMNPTMLE